MNLTCSNQPTKEHLTIRLVDQFCLTNFSLAEIDSCFKTAFKMIKIFKSSSEEETEEEATQQQEPPQTVNGEPTKRRGRPKKTAQEWEPENEDLLQAYRMLKGLVDTSTLTNPESAKKAFEERAKEGKLSIEDCYKMIESFKVGRIDAYLAWVGFIANSSDLKLTPPVELSANVAVPVSDPVPVPVAIATEQVQILQECEKYDGSNKIHKSELLTLMKQIGINVNDSSQMAKATIVNGELNGQQFPRVSIDNDQFVAVATHICNKNGIGVKVEAQPKTEDPGF